MKAKLRSLPPASRKSLRKPSRKPGRQAAPPPVAPGRPGKDKVSLNVARLSDTELLTACREHARAVDDNPAFPDLLPPAEDFDFITDKFAGSTREILALQNDLAAAYARRNQNRRALEAAARARICYVQARSEGRGDLIMKGGFRLQRSPTRHSTRKLSSPEGLAVTLNQNSGQMLVTWFHVKHNRGYFLQFAALTDRDQERNWQLAYATTPKHLFNHMQPGTLYAFRVATLGSRNQHSEWSPEVLRAAA